MNAKYFLMHLPQKNQYQYFRIDSFMTNIKFKYQIYTCLVCSLRNLIDKIVLKNATVTLLLVLFIKV